MAVEEGAQWAPLRLSKPFVEALEMPLPNFRGWGPVPRRAKRIYELGNRPCLLATQVCLVIFLPKFSSSPPLLTCDEQVSLPDLVSSKLYTEIRVGSVGGNSIEVPALTVAHLVEMGASQKKGDLLDASTYAKGSPDLVTEYQPAAGYAIEGMGFKAIDKAGVEFANPRDLFGEEATSIGLWQSQAEACFCALVGTKERAYQSEFSWLSSVSLGHKTEKSEKLNWQAVCR